MQITSTPTSSHFSTSKDHGAVDSLLVEQLDDLRRSRLPSRARLDFDNLCVITAIVKFQTGIAAHCSNDFCRADRSYGAAAISLEGCLLFFLDSFDLLELVLSRVRTGGSQHLTTLPRD
jgi:hypothetical protein